MSQVLRERAIGMLTAGMSTRAVARELNVHFSTISRLQRQFREFGRTPKQSATIMLQNMLQQSVCIIKEFLHKLSETVSGKLIFLIGVSNSLQFIVVTDLSGIMLTFDGVWHFGEVFSSQMNPGFHCTGQMAHTVWRHVGEWFADVNILDRAAHGGGGVMVWAGVCYGQRTQVHFIDGILNAQIPWRDPEAHCCTIYTHDHHLMLQHDNARPHVASICTQFLEAENIPVLVWPAYSPDMSSIEHVWDALDRCIRQRVPVPANIQQLHTAIEEEWSNISQATINNLINSMRSRCVALREANGGHTRYWLVFGNPPPPPQYSKTAHFIVASLRHTCAIIMLSNQHLDMPHLWGGWIISAKEKSSLTQI